MTKDVEACPVNHAELSAWNPLDPSELANPYRTFATARTEAPVFYSDFFQAWVVTRYDDIITLLRDTARFTNRSAIGSGEVPESLQSLLPKGYPWDYPSLVNNDPPSHMRIRRLSNEAFKASVVAKEEPAIRAMVDALIDEFVNEGETDFVAAFANKLPGLVMCRILGVPDEDAGQVIRWGDDVIVMKNPNLSLDERTELARGQADFYAFCESFIADRREQPRDDIMSRLVYARVEDEPALTEQEVISTFSQFLVGGTETTRRLLGSLMLRLLEHPDQLAAVQADLGLVDAAVQETLRQVSPVKGLFRRTTDEVELGGTTIPADQVVVVMWASANHDETHFERPEEFDIFRPNAWKHMAFSKFTHHCIGAPLAQLEARVALEQLLTRLPNVRRANSAELEWLPLVLHMGVKQLDIAWTV